jgi:LysM repeat protein
MGMDNRKAKMTRSAVLKQVAIGLAILAVLSCTILGSAVLTMREGTLISALRPTATSTLQPLVLLTPTETPAAATTLTSPQPTPTATHTVQARAETQTVPVPSPSATLTRPATSIATTTPTITASPTVRVTATASVGLTATAAPTVTPVATPTATARPPATNTPRPVCSAPASWRVYVVRAGDTLTSLATQRGTTVASIVGANCLTTSTIYTGQRLYLPPIAVPPPPPPTTCVPQPPAGWVLYTVQNGDSLYGLAQRFQTTVVQIQQVNCLSGYVVTVGQQLYLPPLPSTPTATWTLVPTADITATPTDLVAPTTSPTPVLPSDTPTTAPTPTVPSDTPTPVPTTPVPTSEADPPAEATATAAPTGG